MDKDEQRTVKQRAKFDQDVAEMADSLPVILRSNYDGLKERFTDAEAWELTKIMAFAMAGGKGMV